MNSKNWFYPFPKVLPNAPISHAGGVKRDFAEHLRRTPASKLPGDDYAIPRRTPHYALFDAMLGDYIDGNGSKYAVLIGDGCRVDFIHVDEVKVVRKKWRKVKKGELIAISGSTGKSTGAHTHITIRTKQVGGKWYNPIPTEQHIRNAWINTYVTPPKIVVAAQNQVNDIATAVQAQLVKAQEELELRKLELEELQARHEALIAEKETEVQQLVDFTTEQLGAEFAALQPVIEEESKKFAIATFDYLNARFDNMPKLVKVTVYSVSGAFLAGLAASSIPPEQVKQMNDYLTAHLGTFSVSVIAATGTLGNLLVVYLKSLAERSKLEVREELGV